MRALNLDSMFTPVQASEVKFKSFYFPGGEYGIKINPSTVDDKVVITTRMQHAKQLVELMMAVDALRRLNVYSIDFAVTDKGDTVLIEINDAFGLSSYGLNPIVYCQMLESRWNQIIKSRDI